MSPFFFRKQLWNFKAMKNEKLSKITETLLFIFLFIVIFSRVYLETAVVAKRFYFSYFVATHHCSWFVFVFFYFALCARYILGLKPEKIKYLALFSPVIFIPIIHAWISETPIKLQYLRGEFSKVLFDILTLYKFSENDSVFFFEMLALLVIFAVLSYIVSRSVLRTILNIIAGFYGSMFIAGLQLFGVYPRTKAYFPIHTVFKNHVFLSLVYFTAMILTFSICFLPEIIKLFKRDLKPLLITLSATVICALFILFGISLNFKPLHTADFILLTILFTTFVMSLIFWKKGTNLPANRFFPIVFSLISLILLIGIIFAKRIFV